MKPAVLLFALGALYIRGDVSHPAKPVAEVERAFAKTSRETSTVNAFLAYLAKDAIMFRQGQPVDGLSLWQDRKPDSTLLNWWPTVADIAESGDLGYTTGPYQFFNKRTDSAPVGNGYYSTIWKKQPNGEWKIKVDLGVRLERLQQLPVELKFAPRRKAAASATVAIHDADAQLNHILNSRSVSFDPASFAKSYRIHRAIIGPSVKDTQAVEKHEAGKKFTFEFVGGEVSASKDFAYSYGKVVRTDIEGDHKSNYLRVWRVEGGEWKIVLDVITEG
ncbi:MAG TPA: nuclear transport factor 2 family protein [Chryseosolibacter sp.]